MLRVCGARARQRVPVPVPVCLSGPSCSDSVAGLLVRRAWRIHMHTAAVAVRHGRQAAKSLPARWRAGVEATLNGCEEGRFKIAVHLRCTNKNMWARSFALVDCFVYHCCAGHRGAGRPVPSVHTPPLGNVFRLHEPRWGATARAAAGVGSLALGMGVGISLAADQPCACAQATPSAVSKSSDARQRSTLGLAKSQL